MCGNGVIGSEEQNLAISEILCEAQFERLDRADGNTWCDGRDTALKLDIEALYTMLASDQMIPK
jgi:hypothetical protein